MRRNPRELESYVVLTLDGREVGRLGPYQTMRGALADAKTMAISRRDNDEANDGIDAVVHTHKDALGQDVAYEVVEGRFATDDLPHVFIARAVAGSTAAARSGSSYKRKAQGAERLRFNPAHAGLSSSVEQDNLSGGWSVYLRAGRRMLNMTGDYFATKAAAEREARIMLAQARAGVPLDTIASAFFHAKVKATQRAQSERANPQITFTARGKPVSFFAKKKR